MAILCHRQSDMAISFLNTMRIASFVHSKPLSEESDWILNLGLMKYFHNILMGIIFSRSNLDSVIDLARNLYFSCLDLSDIHLTKCEHMRLPFSISAPGEAALANYYESHN